jgi:hypothetical protein
VSHRIQSIILKPWMVRPYHERPADRRSGAGHDRMCGKSRTDDLSASDGGIWIFIKRCNEAGGLK